jgi:hypothetical protein
VRKLNLFHRIQTKIYALAHDMGLVMGQGIN